MGGSPLITVDLLPLFGTLALNILSDDIHFIVMMVMLRLFWWELVAWIALTAMSGRHRQGVGGAAGVARRGWRQSRELQWWWFYVDGDGSCDNGDGFIMMVMVEVMMKIKWFIFFGLSPHGITRVMNCKYLCANLLWEVSYVLLLIKDYTWTLDIVAKGEEDDEFAIGE